MNTGDTSRALQSFRDAVAAWSKAVMVIQSWILLSAVYFFVLPWFVWFVKAKRGDKNPSGWSVWSPLADTLEDARRQYSLTK